MNKSQSGPLLTAAQFADEITENTQRIIDSFIARIRAEVASAQNKGRAYLTDHLPQVLVEMAEFLRFDGQREDYDEASRLADLHGKQRASGASYTVSDLRKEYGILSEIILNQIPKHAGLSAHASAQYGKIFSATLSHGTEHFIRNSVSEMLQHKADVRNAQSDHRWFEAALDRVPKPLFLLDLQTKMVMFSNRAAQNMLGVEYGPILNAADENGKPLAPDRIPSSRVLNGERLAGEEIILTAPTGVYHLKCYSEHLPEMEGRNPAALLLLQDITSLKKTQAELEEARKAAERANSAKSQFLANMSHEIRTPLGAIMGFASLLKDESLSRTDQIGFVSVIERNSTQLLRIIDDILDLSKVEAGMMLIEHIEFSLPELLSDFSSLMGFKAREKGISFTSIAGTPLPVVVKSDPTRLRQILMNVVGNAIKFTDNGGVEMRVCFKNGFLHIEVEDTGRGISPDQEVHLFQPFSQADPSTTRKYGGTGLGLVLTRSLSEALGGSFKLKKSFYGKGSTFSFEIKVETAPGVEMVTGLGFESQPVRQAREVGRLAGLRILLVEDSPDNQALISILLGRAGARTDMASDGKSGYLKALEGDYDLVLMDVQMPVMDGVAAVKRLRKEGFKKPVIALTAHAMKEERIRCIEAGFSDFLSKPVNREELVDMIVRYVQA